MNRICITGGAGFVGSNLALSLRRSDSGMDIVCVDSLKRRGSELNLERLRAHDITFVHGDIRCPEDLADLPDFDVLLDCSAEPSVQAGATGSPAYVLHTNLTGTIHLLEAARVRGAAVLFLSTSRAYPMNRLNALDVRETDTRFRWTASGDGVSEEGIDETFPLDGVRSFYGASKLASELLLQEYAHAYDLPALINRCGVIAGPWQMGKVDQGVATLWIARHAFRKPLSYNGFGGFGKQVRDFLHVDDLAALIVKQLGDDGSWDGRVYNVGGGVERSASLLELTGLCEEISGRKIDIGSVPETNPMDVRIYISDARRVMRDYDWTPQRSLRDIVADTHAWIASDRERLSTVLDS